MDTPSDTGRPIEAPGHGRLHGVPAGCAYLGGISREKLYRLIKAGEINVVKIGRRTFIDQQELDRFIDAQATGAR